MSDLKKKIQFWLLFYTACILCMGIGFHMGRVPAQETINKTYLQGYTHRQIESLPSPGLDPHKERKPGLLGKG